MKIVQCLRASFSTVPCGCDFAHKPFKPMRLQPRKNPNEISHGEPKLLLSSSGGFVQPASQVSEARGESLIFVVRTEFRSEFFWDEILNFEMELRDQHWGY